MPLAQPPESPLHGTHVLVLGPEHEALLQAFFDANPAYFIAVSGEAAKPGDALEELEGAPPADWPSSGRAVIGFIDDARGVMIAMVHLVSDLLAPGVWHISTFIVETARHGNGDAQRLYAWVEHWAQREAARWMRLGVVLGNIRAERFWERVGYRQTRLREGMVFGALTQSIRVMFKPLAGGTLTDYLALVERDRP